MVKDGTWDCGGALIFYIVIVIWASRCEPVFNLLLGFLYIWSHCIHIFFYLLSWHHLIGWSSEVSWSLFLPYDLLILEPPYSWRSIVYFGDTAAVLRCSIMVPFFFLKKKLKVHHTVLHTEGASEESSSADSHQLVQRRELCPLFHKGQGSICIIIEVFIITCGETRSAFDLH